jgi:hypothetical protein
MADYLFDIETDGLLLEATRMWLLVMTDLETGESFEYIGDDDGWKERMSSADVLVGHNIIGFDIPCLEKLFGWKVSKGTKIRDTLIMSQVLNYRRFGHDGHSLGRWGEALGYPKGDHDDWTKYSEEMRVYCHRDVELNIKIYRVLMKELKIASVNAPLLGTYLKCEQAVGEWSAQAELKGWPFDRKKGIALFEEMTLELENTTEKIEHKLGLKAVKVDNITPSYLANVAEKAEKAKRELSNLEAELDMLPEYMDGEELEYAKVSLGLELRQHKSMIATLIQDLKRPLGDSIVKSPKWLKSGKYDHHLAKWFDIDASTGQDEDRIVEGDYCRVKIEPLKLSSVSDVKVFLFRNGWEPTEWNYKSKQNSNGRWERYKTSPKITEDSLEFLGGDGKLYLDYLTTSSRHGILNTWLEEVDENDRLHGSCMVVGTPSMRMRHSIIVNVPSVDSAWGKEMRQLFTCKKGWKIVGCDSSGNQARGLAHYLKSQSYIDLLLNGDIHQHNADILTNVMQAIGFDIVVPRSAAKRCLYATLFGASGAKLFSYIMAAQDEVNGKIVKRDFLKAIPGFRDLMDELEGTFGNTKKIGPGYIIGIAGNKIFCDSFHKLLVYLLQATEKATCSAAVFLTMRILEKEGIPYQPLIMMHDEFQVMVPDEHAERVLEIGSMAFKEGPKLFGVTIMDGDGSIGDNWFETH